MTDAVVDLIRRFQGERTQEEYARLLGVAPSTLSLVLAKKRGPELVLVQMLRAFPESAQEIARALAGTSSQPAEPAPAQVAP